MVERVWALGEAFTVRQVLEDLNAEAPRRPRGRTRHPVTILQQLGGHLGRRPPSSAGGPATPSPRRYLGARVDAEVSRLLEDFGGSALLQFARQVEALDPDRRDALRRLGEGE